MSQAFDVIVIGAGHKGSSTTIKMNVLMSRRNLNVVFDHGRSVTNTDAYGRLYARLRNEAVAREHHVGAHIGVEERGTGLGRRLGLGAQR